MPNRKLQDLAQIAGVYSALQAPQQQEAARTADAEQRRMQMALTLLGYQQEQDRAGQQLALQRDQMTQQGQQATARTEAELLQLAGDPNSSEQLRDVVGQKVPAYGQARQAERQAGTQRGIAQQAPVLRALYESNLSDPSKLGKALEAIRPTMSPEVWEGADWTGLNSMFNKPGAAAATGPAAMRAGKAVRSLPGAPARMLQGVDSAMGDVGMNFWAGLMDMQPEAPDANRLNNPQFKNDKLGQLFRALGF